MLKKKSDLIEVNNKKKCVCKKCANKSSSRQKWIWLFPNCHIFFLFEFFFYYCKNISRVLIFYIAHGDMGRLLQCNSFFFILFMKVKIISFLECVCNVI